MKKLITYLLLLSSFFLVASNNSNSERASTDSVHSLTRPIHNKSKKQGRTVYNKADSFEYNFISNKNFDYPNGDEFEGKNLEDGVHSGSVNLDRDGRTLVEKRDGLSKSVMSYSFNDYHEDNDSFINATNMYHAGWDASGVYVHWCWCNATICQRIITFITALPSGSKSNIRALMALSKGLSLLTI